MQLNPQARLSVRLTLIITSVFLALGFSRTTSAQDSAPMALTLPQAVSLALKQNKSLKLKQLEVVESEKNKKIVQADYFPRIKNESTIFHVTELQQVVVPEGAFGSLAGIGPIPAKTEVLGQGNLTAYTSGTGLSQPLTQMFKIHNESRAATTDIN